MSFALATTISAPIKRSLHWWDFISTPSKRATIIVAFITACASFLYIIQTNSIATKGYEITTLSRQLTETRGQNKSLELTIAELRTSRAIEERIAGLNLVRAGKVEYISPNASAVAFAQ